jgi:hypothetical protein
MTKVVLQMIALGLAHVVVFDLSEPPTRLCHRHHVSGWQAMIGDTAIVLAMFARFGMDDRAIEPMDRPGLVTPAQEYIYALVLWGTTLARIERDAVKALMQQCVQGEIAARITFPAGKSFIVDYNLLITKSYILMQGRSSYAGPRRDEGSVGWPCNGHASCSVGEGAYSSFSVST